MDTGKGTLVNMWLVSTILHYTNKAYYNRLYYKILHNTTIHCPSINFPTVYSTRNARGELPQSPGLPEDQFWDNPGDLTAIDLF